MKKLEIIFIFLLFAIVYGIVDTNQAHAQQLRLGFSPPIIQITAQPPASIEAPIGIHNGGETPIELEIRYRLFKPSSKENGEVDYVAESVNIPAPNPKLFDYVQVLEGGHVIKSVVLGPGQQKSLQLHIGLPKNEPFADYYFSILFISKTDESEAESSQTATLGGVGIPVLLTIGSKSKPQGKIEEFSVPTFVEKGPVPFTVRIRNTGDHMITPNGGIIISNMFGQAIGKVNLLPMNILAQSTRALPDSLQSPAASAAANREPIAQNSPQAMWPELFLLGPYSAKLTIALSPEGPVQSATIYFFALPLQFIIGICVAILITLIVRDRLVRLRRRK
jgi:hypothetical protein